MLLKPIFVVGHPRSGTSLVRALLEQNEEIWTIGREAKHIWEHYPHQELHPSNRGWHSNELGAKEATEVLRKSLTAALLAAARRPGPEWTVADKLDFLDFLVPQGVNPYYYDVPHVALAEHFQEPPGQGPASGTDGEDLPEIVPFCFPPRGSRPTAEELGNGIRLMEKSVQSCFRVPFLRGLFPDAKFVFVVRDPKSSIASLTDAWLNPRWFFSYRVPVPLSITGYSDVFPWGKRWWNLSLPPGWRDLANMPLEQLCTLSWRIHNEAILRAFSELNSTGDAILIRYEDVVATTSTVMEQVATATELPFSPYWKTGQLPLVATPALPHPDKWRRHETGIRNSLHLVTDIAEELGYDSKIPDAR